MAKNDQHDPLNQHTFTQRRKALKTLTLAGTAGLLSMSGVSMLHAQDKKKLVFLTPFGFQLSFSPVLYAVASGLFAKEGIEVEVVGGRGAAQSIQLVAAGQAQIGRTGGANYMTSRINNDAPIISIATIAQQSPFQLISGKDKPINSVKEMAGKTIGIASLGGSMEGTVDLMLMRAGVDKKSVTLQRVPDNPASLGLIQSGRIDGFFGNTSTATRLIVQNHPVATMRVDDGFPGQVYVVDEKTLVSNRGAYISFLRATFASVSQIAAMDEAGLKKAIDLMAGKFELGGLNDMKVAIADLRNNAALWTSHGAKNVLKNDEKQWAEALDLLVTAKLIKAKPSKPVYTNELWEASRA